MKHLVKLGLTLLSSAFVGTTSVIITNKIVEQHNYNLIHEINTKDVYTINGEQVSYEEWLSYLESLENGTNTSTNTTTNTEIEEELNNKVKGITYADSNNYKNLIMTEGTEFEWLAVYNASDNVAGGCSNSYVQSVDSKGVRCSVSDIVKEDYLNLSCVYRTANINYESYKINCTNRTSPGNYNGQGGWSQGCKVSMGIYYLENAKVEIVNKSTTTYGSQYVYQIIISYDWAYTQTEFISHLS